MRLWLVKASSSKGCLYFHNVTAASNDEARWKCMAFKVAGLFRDALWIVEPAHGPVRQ